MWPNSRETAYLVTFTEKVLNEKLLFCAGMGITCKCIHIYIYTYLYIYYIIYNIYIYIYIYLLNILYIYIYAIMKTICLSAWVAIKPLRW